MALKDWSKLRWGRETEIKLMTSFVILFFSPSETWKTSKVPEWIQKPFIPDTTGAVCGMEAGQCAWPREGGDQR